MNINEVFSNIDRLFEENRPAEALRYMLGCLEEASKEGDAACALQLLNELIGYYRQVSDRDGVLQSSRDAIALAESMGLKGTPAYATTVLNVANALRAIGELEDSLAYYRIAEDIYNKSLGVNDMRFAGLHNNLSLLYQELGDYENAKKRLLMALKISEANNEGFEIAVTHANLANTCVMAGDFAGAEEHGLKAAELFEKRNCIDAHYCAALSALGMCLYRKEEYLQAESLYEKAMDIMEQCIGKNLQYERLKENRDACHDAALKKEVKEKEILENKKNEKSSLTGMELSRAYYEAYGKAMIHDKFPEYEGKIAVGLCGEGSECFGFDDEISRDHDFGPSFCMWVSDETFSEIGEELSREYDKLPDEFMGFKRCNSQRHKKRRGVFTVSSYLKSIIGTDDPQKTDWGQVPEYSLAAVVNGEIFRDDEGIITPIREQLKKGYPPQVRFLKIAEDCARFSQTGQYNYFRLIKRGDYITADMELMECIKASVSMLHHIENIYLPHEKWIVRSAGRLSHGKELINLITGLYQCIGKEDVTESVKNLTEELGKLFAELLYRNNFISDNDTYLDHHTDELVDKANMCTLTDDELVNLIVKTEFEAFDKVKNEGGRASCQNDWPTFYVMRKSQYLLWDRPMLMQYLYDFNREFKIGHNLITEKYGRMMESTAPEKYEEIKDNFPALSDEKKAIIESVVGIQMQMAAECSKRFPKVFHNARHLYTIEDNPFDTSYETYLRGEISTYSDRMLQLYAGFVVKCAQNGRNMARMTMENTARLYGYDSLEEFEASC